jgi:hypothetical protein
MIACTYVVDAPALQDSARSERGLDSACFPIAIQPLGCRNSRLRQCCHRRAMIAV